MERTLDQQPRSGLSKFLQRLLHRSALTSVEQQAVLGLTGNEEHCRAHYDIVSPGQTVDSACLVVQGLVARYDQMLDGQRQITSFYIAGDMCDLHSVVAPTASWSITAISHAAIMRVPHSQLRELCLTYPAIALAFWRDGTVDASVFAKWVGNLGRKDAKARIAHVLCEMGIRSESAGLGTRTSYEFQATQEQLADATGVTTVHVNRTLQEIRGEGLLTFKNGSVEVAHWDALVSVAEFDGGYLMLDGPPHRIATTSETQPTFVD
jgi:CRP-like cAMP-binding protein